jgi:transposase-like protein
MGTKARRRFTAQFKLDAVLELLAGHKSVAQICRERQITDKLLYDWKRAFLERAPSVFETGTAATSEMHTRIAELERMVGRLTMENDILKKAGVLSPSHWNGSER